MGAPRGEVEFSRNAGTVLLTLLLAFGTPAHAESVALKREAGTLVLPVVINDRLILNFTLDSGASDVTIPEDVARTLVRTGTITRSDLPDIRVTKDQLISVSCTVQEDDPSVPCCYLRDPHGLVFNIEQTRVVAYKTPTRHLGAGQGAPIRVSAGGNS
jgi:hypothetical protein